jgi:hypothetical protein
MNHRDASTSSLKVFAPPQENSSVLLCVAVGVPTDDSGWAALYAM